MKMLPSGSTAMPSGLSRCSSFSPLPPKRAEELAGGLVEHLHKGVDRVGGEQMAVLAEGEVLDILELAFAGAVVPIFITCSNVTLSAWASPPPIPNAVQMAMVLATRVVFSMCRNSLLAILPHRDCDLH